MSALVRWLPELTVATADDIARFGPQAARVRTLLDFLPTMSDDAVRASADARNVARWGAADGGYSAWRHGAYDDAYNAANRAAENAAMKDKLDAAYGYAMYSERNAADAAAASAGVGEVVSNLISPENYRILTNPLAVGRAVDVLAPRYSRTPFRELLQELSPKSAITQPRDVLAVGRIARSPEDIREIAMTLIADGVPVDEAYRMARLV